MTQRERKLALILGVTVGVLGGFVILHKLFLEPFLESKDQIARLDSENSDKSLQVQRMRREKREFQRLQTLSLPADPDPKHHAFDLAWGEYDKYLRELCRLSSLKSIRISGQPPLFRPPQRGRLAKKELFTPLTYTVEATGELRHMVAMMEKFYHTPLLHQIKSVTVKPPRAESSGRAAAGKSRELQLRMTVEALLVEGTEKRSYLFPTARKVIQIYSALAMRHVPGAALALVPLAIDKTGMLKPKPLVTLATPGQYSYIDRKNVFFEPKAKAKVEEKKANPRKPPKHNRNEFFILTDITHDSNGRSVAYFYDQLRGGSAIKIDPKDRRYQSIPVLIDTEDEKLIRGEVVYIGERDIIFRLRLVARKKGEFNSGQKILCLDEANRMYSMRKSFWEALVEEETLFSNDELTFQFRGKLMVLDVEKSDAKEVIFKVYKKYLDQYYAIHVGQDLHSALEESLSDRQLRALGYDPDKQEKSK